MYAGPSAGTEVARLRKWHVYSDRDRRDEGSLDSKEPRGPDDPATHFPIVVCVFVKHVCSLI